MWRIENLMYCWWDCKLVQSLWKTVWSFLKIKIELSYDSAISLLGIYSKNYENSNLKRYMHTNIHCSIYNN